MQKILLIGILGTYNYGCEAIVRGTFEVIRKVYPDAEISYASYDYKNDCERLKDLDINIVKRPSKFKRFTLQNVLWKMASILKMPITRPYDSLSWINGYDTVFSIGGDMYTLSSNGSYKRDLPLFFEECQKKGLKYILWGASVGPFSNNPEGEKFYRSHLKKADLIVSRESITTDYLKSIGITKNVCEAPDPAFFVKNIKFQNKKTARKRIGINLSPLSAVHEYNGDTTKAIENQAEAISRILIEKDWEIFMIPHVVSPRIWEDDLRYLQEIYKKLPDCLKSKVKIIDTDPGFIGLKPILSTLDCVIAARMHCAINSICCNIPVILLSYSEKAKGMCKYVYNDSSRTMPLTGLEDTDRILNLIENPPKETNLAKIENFDFSKIL